MNCLKTLFTGLFTLTAITLFCQKAEMKLGGADSKNFVTQIIGQDSTGTYVLAEKEKKKYIEKYTVKDYKFKQEFSKQLKFPDHIASNEELEGIFCVKKQVFVFTSLYDIKADKYFLYARKINSTGDLEPNENPLFSIDAKRGTEHSNLKVEVSADSTKFLLFTRKAILVEGKRKMKIGILGADLKMITQFEEVFEGNFTFGTKEPDPRIWVAGTLLDKSNKVFLIINKYFFGKESSDFSVIGYDLDKQNKVSWPIEIPEDKIASLTYSLGADGLLNLAGFYNERVLRNGLKKHQCIIGAFFMKFDVFNNKVVQCNKQDFETKTFLAYLPQKKYDKGERLPANFSPRKIIETTDSCRYLVSEYFRADYNGGSNTIIPLTRTSTAKSSTLLYYNDILVTKILPDGKISWSTIIPKNQTDDLSEWAGTGTTLPFFMGPYPGINETGNSIYYSFITLVKDNKLVFLFNDHEANLEKVDALDSRTLLNGKTSVPAMVILEANGKFKKRAVYTGKAGEAVFRPRVSLQIGNNSFLTSGDNGETNQLGILFLR